MRSTTHLHKVYPRVLDRGDQCFSSLGDALISATEESKQDIGHCLLEQTVSEAVVAPFC